MTGGTRQTTWCAVRRGAWAMLLVTATPVALAAQANADGSRPECPHTWPDRLALEPEREIANGAAIVTASSVGSSTFTPTRDIPEFNDCQRVLLPPDPIREARNYGRRATRYGPLMALFLSDRNDQLEGEKDAVAAVQVFNYAPAFYYPPLGIEPLYNCLYLWRVENRWQARMVPTGTRTTCALTIAPGRLPPGTDLAVIPARQGPFTSFSDYPKAARWEWDEANNIQYIGLRCGSQWCQVGRARSSQLAEFVPAPPYTTSASTANAVDRVRYIAGWHDRQRLAVFRGGTLVPSEVVGTVFPAPRLASYSQPGDFSQFRPVAYIAIEASSPTAEGVSDYRQKFNYDLVAKGSPLDQMTQLSMCFGTVKSCMIPASIWELLETKCMALISPGPSTYQQRRYVPDPHDRWWARLVSPARHTTMYRCTTKRDNPGAMAHGMPATTRFRWLAKDETTWNYCAMGCCEVQGS